MCIYLHAWRHNDKRSKSSRPVGEETLMYTSRWTELARRWVTWRIRPIRFNFVCLPAAGKFQFSNSIIVYISHEFYIEFPAAHGYPWCNAQSKFALSRSPSLNEIEDDQATLWELLNIRHEELFSFRNLYRYRCLSLANDGKEISRDMDNKHRTLENLMTVKRWVMYTENMPQNENFGT